MEALKIIEIVNQYKSGKLNFAEASLALIIIGLNADEVKKLLLNVRLQKLNKLQKEFVSEFIKYNEMFDNLFKNKDTK